MSCSTSNISIHSSSITCDICTILPATLSTALPIMRVGSLTIVSGIITGGGQTITQSWSVQTEVNSNRKLEGLYDIH